MRDVLNISVRVTYLEKNAVLPAISDALRLLQEHNICSPTILKPSVHDGFEISGFNDSAILQFAEKDLNGDCYGFDLFNSQNTMQIGFMPSSRNFVFLFSIEISETDIDIMNSVSSIFRKYCPLLDCNYSKVYLSKVYTHIQEKYFEWESRTPHFTFFSWLNYFGPEEFRKQGGEAIFDNPYIKAERLGEGVLIQVGESPFDATTPEGEELIVKATRALPPVVK